MSEDAKPINQINMKALGFPAKTIRSLVEDKNEAIFLVRIVGVVADYFTGETDRGGFTGFRGDFKALTNNNEVFTSRVAFFPAQIAGSLLENLKQGVVEIEVTADIFAQESDKNASGYAYMCEPIMSKTGKEKMSRLTKLLQNDLPVSLDARNKAVALEDKAVKK